MSVRLLMMKQMAGTSKPSSQQAAAAQSSSVSSAGATVGVLAAPYALESPAVGSVESSGSVVG